MYKSLFLILFTSLAGPLMAQNVPPVFILPNVSDTTLEADHDTCIEIHVEAPEAEDSILLWMETELVNEEDTSAFLTQSTGTGQLHSYLCFYKACRKVRDTPYLFKLYARDSSFDTSVYNINIRLNNSLLDELRSLPNVITPDGDGKNDEFSLKDSKAQCAKLFNVYIYNRWGQKMYSSNRISFSWKAEGAAEGVYFYVIEAGESRFKGTITLIR